MISAIIVSAVLAVFGAVAFGLGYAIGREQAVARLQEQVDNHRRRISIEEAARRTP
jgi:hypothetical protein